MKPYYYFLLPLFALMYSSCTKVITVTPEVLNSIKLNDTLSMFAGSVVQINYTVSPSGYQTSSLVWKSSDTTVISVTNTGKVSAKKKGTSSITVSNAKATVSVSVLVTVKDKFIIKPPVDSLLIGLIAYYPLNNSAADSSGHNNNGTGVDLTCVPDRFGKANSAYGFNGTSSYISVKDKQELRLNKTDFTLSMWVKLDDYNASSGSALFSKNTGPFQNGWNYSITGFGTANTNIGNEFYNVSGGDDPHAVGDTIVGLHKWRMVTATYDAIQQKISFYINGKFDNATSGIPTPNPSTSIDLLIGKNSYVDPAGSTPPYYIKGKLDDIRIYNRKLTISQISKLYKLPY